MSELKRRHHYVWQYYLAAWATRDLVTCLRDSRVFETGTGNLAVETDFYRFTDLTTHEQDLIARLAMATHDPLMRELNAGWLALFLAPLRLRELAHTSNANRELLDQLDVRIANLEEDLHSKIEERAIPHIDDLRHGRLDFLNSVEHRTTFLHFLAVQYLRTRKILDAMRYTLRNVPDVSIDRVWSVLRHCFATNIGVSLSWLWESTEVSLLQAPPQSHFITSDQPAVNLHATGKGLEQPVEQLVLFYPVSPQLALRWDPAAGSQRLRKASLSSEDVRDLNQVMYSMAHKQVFAVNGEILRAMQGSSCSGAVR